MLIKKIINKRIFENVKFMTISSTCKVFFHSIIKVFDYKCELYSDFNTRVFN